MDKLFSAIYETLNGVFGDGLGGYLDGFCDVGATSYSQIGISTTICTIIVCGCFYFLYVNSSRHRFKHWFLFLSISGILSGLIAFLLPYRDLQSGIVCSDFIFTLQDVIFFGLLNLILSMVFFFIISLLFKMIGKPAARHTPF